MRDTPLPASERTSNAIGQSLAVQEENYGRLLGLLAARDGGRRFGTVKGVSLTFGEIDRGASAVAAAMHARDIRSGDRVAVMLRNGAANLSVIFGLAKAGITWVPINARQRGDGLAYIVRHSRAKLLVLESDLIPVVEASLGPGGDVALLPSTDEEAEAPLQTILRGGGEIVAPARPPDAPAAIMYTSGTTGPPKGVIVSYGMLRLAAEGAMLASRAQPGDVFFVWEPLYHIGGAQLILLPLVYAVELAIVERFSVGRFWDQVRTANATHIHYVGGILQMLLKQPSTPQDRSHGVRFAWGGGCGPQIWREFEARFGVTIQECYGLTEASSITTVNRTGVLGSVGTALPWFTVAIVDAAGRRVVANQRGEIVIRARVPGGLFTGYFDDPNVTASVLRDGALYTGDLGSLDADGNLFLHGRISDSVRCRGENVSAWEVEHVAAQHPSVEDCAMVGVAADIGEQDIKLFVKARTGYQVDPAELSTWLSQRLAPYQNPRYICVVDDFERTASQRVVKPKLVAIQDGCWDRTARKDS